MGCDIHMFVEEKVKNRWIMYSGGKEVKQPKMYWSQIKDSFRNKRYDPTEPLGEYNLPYTSEPYHDRNYALFSFLAGVRSYDDSIKPMAEPKGIPKGVSTGIQKEIDEWGFDGHSHSYFTLEEINKVDWNSKAKEYNCYDFLDSLYQIRNISDKHKTKPKHIRIVFWFDN